MNWSAASTSCWMAAEPLRLQFRCFPRKSGPAARRFALPRRERGFAVEDGAAVRAGHDGQRISRREMVARKSPAKKWSVRSGSPRARSAARSKLRYHSVAGGAVAESLKT